MSARIVVNLTPEEKAEFMDLCEGTGSTPAGILRAFMDRVKAGDIEVREDRLIGHYEGSQIESTPIDLSDLIDAARRYRATPESLLSMMIRRCCP